MKKNNSMTAMVGLLTLALIFEYSFGKPNLTVIEVL